MKAIGDILVLIKEVPIKGSIQNYDPVNYDDYLADKYGGFGGDNAGNGGNRNNGGNNRSELQMFATKSLECNESKQFFPKYFSIRWPKQ